MNRTLLQNLGFEDPGDDFEIMSGSYLNLTCDNSADPNVELFATDSWTSNIFLLECLHSGEFKMYEE